MFCSEPIEENDRGVIMVLSYVRADADGKPVVTAAEPAHMECDLRSAIGGIGHLNGTCSCYDGAGGHPDAGLSYRDSARRVLAEVEKFRGKPL